MKKNAGFLSNLRLGPWPGAALGLCASLWMCASLGCSQNEYSVPSPPPAPKNARSAHVVKKTEGGMNSVAGPEEEAPAQNQPAAPSSGEPNVLRGTVTLPPALASKFRAGETLYVIVRDAQGSLAPVAALKLRVQAFPVPFEITGKDAMMGGAIPAEAQILLRLDEDGDLATRGPGDLVGGPVAVRAGQEVTIPLGVPST
jgi:hypothetical protein